MILELIRLEEHRQYGTFGVLRINKEVFCVTLEPRDEENAPSVSSIPAQQYQLLPYDSPTHGPTWQVMDVPGREWILFHPGNLADHTEGCIMLAQHWGKLRGDRAVLNSGATFARFLSMMTPYPAAHLTIREVY